jgi:hypothetical protein
MSFKVEVQVSKDPTWYSDEVRLPTEIEAEHYAEDLAYRWTLVNERRVVEVDEPANAHWADGELVWDDVAH